MSVSPAVRATLVAQLKSMTVEDVLIRKLAQENILRSDDACQHVKDFAIRTGKGNGVTFEVIRRAAQGNLDMIAQYRPEV